jgi:hypothetical protein
VETRQLSATKQTNMKKHNSTQGTPRIGPGALLGSMIEALTRIANCIDAPDIDATGDWQKGLHCGVEDRDCRDRYDGADYGHTVGVEKALEWASNEAKHALAMLPNESSSATGGATTNERK